MAKKAKPSTSLSAIRREIASIRKQEGKLKGPTAKAMKRFLRVRVKVLRSCEEMLDDFYGDPPPDEPGG